MSRDFDGSTGALRSTASPVFLEPFIISLWFKVDTLPTFPAVSYLWLRQNSFNFSNWRGINIDSSGRAGYVKRTATTSKTARVTTGYLYGAWNHVVVWDTGGINASDMVIYQNGGNKNTQSGVNPLVGGGVHSVLGARETASTPTFTEFFDGQIAEVGEWDNGDFGIAADTECDVFALALYQSRLKPNWYRPNICRYIPLLRDEDAALSMPESTGAQPTLFTAFGTIGIGEHPPLSELRGFGTHRRRGGDIERHYPRGVLRGVGRGVYSG